VTRIISACGKHRKAFGHHDAGRAVDLLDAQALHPALEHALVAEPVDQRDGRQQRGRQQRDQRDAAKQRLVLHAGARQRIGEAEGQRHGDQRDGGGHPEAVPEAFQQRRGFGVLDEIVEPDEVAGFAQQGLLQDGQQRRARKAIKIIATSASAA
jgi:hypothetical protein